MTWTETPGISPYADTRGTTGYLARYYTAHGTLTRLFSLGRYRTMPAAWAAAHAWLVQQAATTPLVPRYRTRPLPTKQSDLPAGITYYYKRWRSGGAWCYAVSWRERGRPHTKTFLVHKYPSQAAAFQSAYAFRKHCEAVMQAEREATYLHRLQVATCPADAA